MGGSQSRTDTVKAQKRAAAANSISQVDRAVLDLKNTRDRLSRYRKKLAIDESRLVQRAREAKKKGQTKVALNLLKLKKVKTNEVEQVEAQLLNLHQMVQTIDSKQNESQVLQAMSKGKDALQKLHEETSVDDVLDLMDQIQEQNEVEKEISDILQGVPSLSIDDEAAVEAELEALMQAEGISTPATTEPALPDVPTTKPLPVAPTDKLLQTATAEADERVALPS